MNIKFLHTVLILLFALGAAAQSDRVKNLSEVDSTFVSNDSVFVSSGGNNFYSGINDVLIGNVLFVSENGNDSTARPNSLSEKYATISAAFSAAGNGDLIYVFPGTFSAAGVLLARKQVNFYLESGAVLSQPFWNFADASAINAKAISVTGNGKLINTTQYQTIFDIRDNNRVFLQCDTVYVQEASVSTVYDGIINAEIGTVYGGCIYLGANDANGGVSSFTVNELRWTGTNTNASSTIVAGLYNTVSQNQTIVVNIKTAHRNFGKLFYENATLDNCKITINIDELLDETGTADAIGIVYIDSNTSTRYFRNSSLSFNIGNYTTNDSFFGALRTNTTNANWNYFPIHLNIDRFVYTNTSYSFMERNTAIFYVTTDSLNLKFSSKNADLSYYLIGTRAAKHPKLTVEKSIIKCDTSLINISASGINGIELNQSYFNCNGSRLIRSATAVSVQAIDAYETNHREMTALVDVQKPYELGLIDSIWGEDGNVYYQEQNGEIDTVQVLAKSSGELSTYFTNTPADSLSLTTSYIPYTPWQLTSVSGPSVTLSPGSDSLLLDAGKYEIHYDLQWISYTPGLADTAYVISAIREGAGVVNKSLRKVYKQSSNPGVGNHASVTYRTTIAIDNTPVSLVLNGDDGSSGGHEILVEKAILYVNRIE